MTLILTPLLLRQPRFGGITVAAKQCWGRRVGSEGMLGFSLTKGCCGRQWSTKSRQPNARRDHAKGRSIDELAPNNFTLANEKMRLASVNAMDRWVESWAPMMVESKIPAWLGFRHEF